MRYFIIALFLFFITLSMSLGDVFGITLSIVGFLIIDYFCEEYDEAKLPTYKKDV